MYIKYIYNLMVMFGFQVHTDATLTNIIYYVVYNIHKQHNIIINVSEVIVNCNDFLSLRKYCEEIL